MSSNRRLGVVLLGNFGMPEFEAARALISKEADAMEASDAAGLLERLAGHGGVELVVVAQELPRQWAGPWIDELRRACPLVRVVAVLGSWCEGETRTGVPLAADVRVFWYHFPDWWARQMERLAAGRAAQWSDHGSHGPEDAEPTDATLPAGLAVVAAADRESAESIALACELGGWCSVWARLPDRLPLVHGANAIVYDAAQLDEPELAAVGRLRDVYGELPVVALCDFPRIDRVQAAAGAGVAAVLGKPFDVDDLVVELLKFECRTRNVECMPT